jgi:hypothetical protein
MKIKVPVLIVLSILGSALSSHAIENLRISVQSSNVILSWPSLTNENFIVEYRELLTTNTPWTSLASNYPAKAGTNWTTFTHSNIVVYPPPDTNGGGGGSFGGPPGFNFATVANAQTETLSAEDLLPYPWNPRYQPIQSSTLMSSQTLNAEGGGGPENLTSYTPRSMGFYRVVRTGISLWSITNGMVLANSVRVPVEIGIIQTQTLSSVFVSGDPTQAVTVTAIELDTFNPTNDVHALSFVWNTQLTTNGLYNVFAGASVDLGALPSRKYSLLVSNLIWFPEQYNWAGYFIEVQAQSVHAGGTYEVKIFDESDFNFLTLTGTNDGQGFITYGGVRGFRVQNYNANGVQYADSFYKIVVRTTQSGASAAPASVMATNFVWVEPPWPGGTGSLYTQFAIGYMPVFGAPGGGNTAAAALDAMVRAIYTAAEGRPGYDTVINGNSGAPFTMTTQGDFTTLLRDLRVDPVRNLYYYGHGTPDVIGNYNKKAPQGNRYLSKEDFAKFLKNKGSPFTTTNAHPFRFVFLDGCRTAAGDMCLAFGIPKQTKVPLATFANKGLRARAFCGWNEGVVVGFANAISGHHNYIAEIFDNWVNGIDPNTGQPNGIGRAAFLARATFGQSQNLIIYGYEGLQFNDTLP